MEEDLSLSTDTVTLLLLLPMVERIARGSHQNEGLAERTNVSFSDHDDQVPPPH